jgi:chaperonin GroEL (HSP60 family)
MAAQTIANIVKSSLGPLGLDKMMVDNIGVRLYLFSFPYRDLTFE